MSSQIVLEKVEWGTPQYSEGLKLRDKVLRQPLGMSIYNDDLKGEKNDIHILAAADSGVVGVLFLRKVDEITLQMKQVAVDDSVRGTGVGRQMVDFAERLAAEAGYQTIVLHARKVAVPFYEKLEYVQVGEPFTEVGIPHRSMIKQLG
ncbi:GNAT family N-acetyltransferase [Paenibacillus caui]|uniref:GNAT family N-acetyltransferase n=1 Tax=Paenibacillus caui TaxID=2873927 RepID=UPI001CA7D7DB|nr:GNAT family N-acetyltransferase [Paenibacillus caui]